MAVEFLIQWTHGRTRSLAHFPCAGQPGRLPPFIMVFESTDKRDPLDDPLATPAQFVRGVGPHRAHLLEKLGLRTVRDLLWNLPRDILDLTEVRRVDRLEEGRPQSVRGTVVDVDGRSLSHNRTLAAVLLDCEGGHLRGVWFNQTWPLLRFRPGHRVLFSGKPKRSGGRWEISHPQVQWLEEDDRETTAGIQTRYGLTEGLAMHEMRRLMRAAVEDYAQEVPEHLPAQFLLREKLPPLPEALRQLHLPQTRQEYEAGKRRLVFDDLLEFQLGLALRRRYWKKSAPAPVLAATPKIDARIRRLFPFEFTAGQNRAVREIAADLASNRAMHRLLQADVGAGKTAVALYAMLVAVAAGYQTVLMAPTEVLAAQHWETVQRALVHSRVNRLFLTGSLTPARRRQALEEIRTGRADLIVGTQAVIQSDVQFQKLGLAVIDEQHKFGVMQRAAFATADVSPHILVMTATPIPRSLCLTQYGDLDVTTITELPPGRQRVVTSRVTGPQARRKMWDFLRRQLQAGRQAYIVCPRIEAGAEVDSGPALASAEQVYEELRTGELREFRVGLVHGQLDRPQKTDVMDRFRDGEIQVLVSTTVIEVGLDVPNATLMVVYQAERFGLSQLHQLRGRIARGSFQGYCFLLTETDLAEAISRLSALESTSDGFRIAEADFALRGPGDVLGTRQHGELPLQTADLVRDHEVLLEARAAAFKLVDTGAVDSPEFAPLKIRVLERFGKLMQLPHSG